MIPDPRPHTEEEYRQLSAVHAETLTKLDQLVRENQRLRLSLIHKILLTPLSDDPSWGKPQ